jgi:hypothetical protein
MASVTLRVIRRRPRERAPESRVPAKTWTRELTRGQGRVGATSVAPSGPSDLRLAS